MDKLRTIQSLTNYRIYTFTFTSIEKRIKGFEINLPSLSTVSIFGIAYSRNAEYCCETHIVCKEEWIKEYLKSIL